MGLGMLAFRTDVTPRLGARRFSLRGTFRPALGEVLAHEPGQFLESLVHRKLLSRAADRARARQGPGRNGRAP
jgi:hypothetical protein